MSSGRAGFDVLPSEAELDVAADALTADELLAAADADAAEGEEEEEGEEDEEEL